MTISGIWPYLVGLVDIVLAAGASSARRSGQHDHRTGEQDKRGVRQA